MSFPTKKKAAALAAAAAAMLLGAAPAHASLQQVGPQDFSGTGLGAVNTVLTLQSPGRSAYASGSVAFGDAISGDALTGASQTQTRTLADLGVGSASDLLVVFNAVEPGAYPGVTLSNLVLSIYSPGGDVLFNSGAFEAVNFADTMQGAGNSGFVFALDAEQQAQAAAAFGGADWQNNVVGLSATVGCNALSPAGCLGATGGFETFYVASAAGTTPPIPEPGTYALMAMGLGLVGAVVRRRRQGR